MASFLDILAPNRVPSDTGIDRRRGPADLETCVRYDLQTLLNTRRPPDAFTGEYPELPTSILNFGLRDFAFAEIITKGDRDRLAQHIADVIAAFEPRLTEIRVSPSEAGAEATALRVGAGGSRQTTIHFHIAARLIGPTGETEAEFENVFEWTTGHHEVSPS